MDLCNSLNQRVEISQQIDVNTIRFSVHRHSWQIKSDLFITLWSVKNLIKAVDTRRQSHFITLQHSHHSSFRRHLKSHQKMHQLMLNLFHFSQVFFTMLIRPKPKSHQFPVSRYDTASNKAWIWINFTVSKHRLVLISSSFDDCLKIWGFMSQNNDKFMIQNVFKLDKQIHPTSDVLQNINFLCLLHPK